MPGLESLQHRLAVFYGSLYYRIVRQVPAVFYAPNRQEHSPVEVGKYFIYREFHGRNVAERIFCRCEIRVFGECRFRYIAFLHRTFRHHAFIHGLLLFLRLVLCSLEFFPVHHAAFRHHRA